MKKIFVFFLLSLIIVLPANTQTVKIIFDSDMESDVDDVGALAMLHGLADRGDAEILATISCSLNPWSAPMLDVINTYYGRPDIPIGNVKTFGVYRNSIFARIITEKYPQDTELGEYVEDAVTMYRKLLSEQEDSSVVIVTLGYLTNISNLLHSGPDKFSSLNGEDLVREKVQRIVIMGGAYPYHTDPGKYGNFKPDPAAAVDVATNCPVQIIFTGGQTFANDIQTGGILFRSKQKNNPVKESYEIFLESWNREYHHSADLIAVYVAVCGYEPYFKVRNKGYYHIFEDGTNLWRVAPDNPKHSIVGEFADGVSPDQVAEAFDKLMLKEK